MNRPPARLAAGLAGCGASRALRHIDTGGCYASWCLSHRTRSVSAGAVALPSPPVAQTRSRSKRSSAGTWPF